MDEVQCPDCHLTMEVGFVPERGDMHSVVQMLWHAGGPEPITFLGFDSGSVQPATDAPGLPIWALRCPNCGLLRLHALPRPAAD